MRGVAAAVMATSAVVSASSCVGLFELDGYAGVAPELCDLLRTCYGDDFYADCLARVSARLRDADEATRAAYLQSFADDRCLETCTSARRCLDAAPLCDAHGGTCGQDEHCCGFLVGQTACGTQGCCASDGVACSVDGDCCESRCEAGICGGVACLEPGESCDEDFECCTEICLRGQCSLNTCLPDGSECIESAECCNGFCDGNICREPECKPEGRPCASPDECCGGNCIPSDDSELGGVCSFGECLPSNAACEVRPEAFPCCAGSCDPDFGRCTEDCARVGEACLDVPCCGGSECSDDGSCSCLLDGVPCTDSKECCSGVCSANFVCEGTTACQPGGTMCGGTDTCCSKRCLNQICCFSPQCHDPCVVGPPLSLNCVANGDPMSCVAQVCGQEPSCCCNTWEKKCVDLYASCAAVACPVPTPN